MGSSERSEQEKACFLNTDGGGMWGEVEPVGIANQSTQVMGTGRRHLPGGLGMGVKVKRLRQRDT